MTLHQCVIAQISSLFHEFIKLTGVSELGKFTQIRGKMMLMSSTAMLLEVFERAGHAIEEYLQLQQPDVQRDQVEKDVSIRLEEAGCKLKDGDCDFSIQDLFRKKYLAMVNGWRTRLILYKIPMVYLLGSQLTEKKLQNSSLVLTILQV